MPFAVQTTLQNIESYLAASGYFQSTQVGEPKKPPEAEFSASVFMSRVSVVELTLNSTIEVHVPTVRIYRQMFAEPEENIEFDLGRIISQVSSDLLGEYDLGATIRNVDAGGQHGTPLSAQWGYLDVGGTMFRIVDMTVPLIVDDSATLAA